MKWPLRYRFWHFLHCYFNRAAWRFARPPGPDRGSALRIDHQNSWWRLNDWTARHYTNWYIKEMMKKHED